MKNMRVLLTLLACSLILLLSGCDLFSREEPAGAYPWNREEEYLVSCTLEGDTVQFRYAMTYTNKSKYDVSISHIVCRFDLGELEGWFGRQPDAMDEKIQSGVVDSAEGEVMIPAGETRVITFVFEGPYLGGELPDSLSKPNRVIWGERLVSSNENS